MNPLGNLEMMYSKLSDLGQMCDADHLMKIGQGPELLAHDFGHATADARIYLIKDESLHGLLCGQNPFQREDNPGELTA